MRVEKLGDKKLELTNNGELSIFFVGSGSAFTKKMNQTNILIIKGEDHLMVDCGTKTPQALFDYGLPIFQLNNFFITHTHADHIGGLEEVMLMNRYVVKKKPNIYITGKFKRNLWNNSLKGGTEGNEDTEGKKLSFDDLWCAHSPRKVKNVDRDTWNFKIGELDISFFRTMHTPDTSSSWKDSAWSTGLVIDNKVLFTSDTRFDPDMLDYCQKNWNIEIIFHDCQFYEGGVHASLTELNKLSVEVKRKTVLMHYGDNWRDFNETIKKSDFIDLVKQGYFYKF